MKLQFPSAKICLYYKQASFGMRFGLMVCALERQGAQGAEVILILIIYINRADLPWYNEPVNNKK